MQMKDSRTIDNIVTLLGPTHVAHDGDAGIDVFYQGEKDIKLDPLQRAHCDTQVTAQFHSNDYYIQVCPRSGLAFKHGVTVLNSPGIIDSGFTGNIKVCLVNLSEMIYTIHPGDKIAQLVISDNYNTSQGGAARDSNGFGSSGF